MPSGSPLVAHFSSLNSRCDATEIVKNIYKYIYMYRYIYIYIHMYIYIHTYIQVARVPRLVQQES